MISDRRRLAFTLLELIVVIAMIGIIASVSALVVAHPWPSSETLTSQIGAIRHRAIATGTPVTTILREAGTASYYAATAFPDGSVVTNAPGIDHLAGRPSHVGR